MNTQQSADEAPAILSLRDVRFRWPSGQRDVIALDTFSLARGERVFLKGASGSGKTTLLSLIGGINVPNSGEVQVLGQALSDLRQGRRDQFRADHIGYIFQLFNLLPYLSVIENITLACKFSALRTQRALQKSATLEREAERLLEHLQLPVAQLARQSVGDLSVGQQQRVAVARALIGSPELIIADEPTSALDADAREQFLHLLLQECAESGASVLFVSHDSALESTFDRSVALHAINHASDAFKASQPSGETP